MVIASYLIPVATSFILVAVHNSKKITPPVLSFILAFEPPYTKSTRRKYKCNVYMGQMSNLKNGVRWVNVGIMTAMTKGG